MDDFEAWAADKLRSLRQEAQALETALGLYRQRSRDMKASSGNSGRDDKSPRRSKYDPLFAAWEKASREQPLDYDAMERIALGVGMPVERHLLRSMIFAQKKLGRAKQTEQGYVWLSPQLETASSDKEDAA